MCTQITIIDIIVYIMQMHAPQNHGLSIRLDFAIGRVFGPHVAVAARFAKTRGLHPQRAKGAQAVPHGLRPARGGDAVGMANAAPTSDAALRAALHAALGGDPAARAHSDRVLDACAHQPGYATRLLHLSAPHAQDEAPRLLAATIVKNVVLRTWTADDPAHRDLRLCLLQRLGEAEPCSAVGAQLACAAHASARGRPGSKECCAAAKSRVRKSKWMIASASFERKVDQRVIVRAESRKTSGGTHMSAAHCSRT